MGRPHKERALFHLALIFSLKAANVWCKLNLSLLRKIMKKPLLIILSIALFGCPATPKIIDVENGNERQLSCQQLSMEINIAEQAKAAAHAQDHFRAADIFPPTGMISVANIWRAGDHATERLALLNRIANEKGCMSRPYGSLNHNIVLAQYIPQEQPRIPSANTQTDSTTITAESTPKQQETQKENASDDTNKSDDDELSKDQDPSVYVQKGYDSEVFPRIKSGGTAVATGH